MKKIYIYLSVTLFFIISACSNISDIWKECNWVNDTNGIKLWTPINEDATTYTWKGQSWNSYAHGKGTITIYDANNNIIKQDTATAYYGAMSKWHIKDVPNGKYVGEVYEKTMDGFGILVKKDSIFVGQFKNSIPNGRLDWYVNNRLYYTGNWENGSFNGEGTLYKEDDTETTGIWKNGAIYEKMIEYSDSLGYYYGYFSNGKFKGYLNICTEEVTYEGDFFEDYPEGFGSALFDDDSYYSGYWNKGKKSGYGDYVYPNSDCYFGDWLNDMQDGFGSYYFANGDSYVGQWKNGLQHGEGRYESTNFTYIGNWEEGWINGEGRMDYSNGDYYEGNFVENQRYGIGVYHSATGNVYEGEFVDNIYNGLGIYYFNDGSIYEGEFENGRIKGDGTFYCVVDNDTLAITAFWDGSNKFPENVSILFSSGDIYEGVISNGTLSSNGSWYKLDEGNKNSIEKTQEWYAKNEIKIKKAINICLDIIDIVDNVVTVATLFTPLAPVAAVKLGAKMAIKTTGKVIVKTITKKASRKIAVSLSKSATKKTIKNSAIKIGKDKAFKKVINVTKDANGQLIKKLSTSKLSTIGNRITGRKAHQMIQSKDYHKALSKNPELKKMITKNVEANGGTLRKNMEVFGGKKMKKRNLKEAKLSKLNSTQRSQAHHIVPGNSQKAQRARDILACCGIDINDPRNGIMLPQSSKSIHKGTIHGRHVSEYDDFVVQKLENMLKKNGGKCSERDCEKVLDNIKIGLYKGNIELLRNHRVNKTFGTKTKRR